MKEFAIADTCNNADIVLIVVSRGVGSATYGQRVDYSEYYGSAALTSVPLVANSYWVSTVMQVGQYRKEFVGTYTTTWDLGGNWYQCADQVAKSVRSWTKANATQLATRRIH